jgi:hypothetical protein
MTAREALEYLRTITISDPKAVEALRILTQLADTADVLAKLHVEETVAPPAGEKETERG